jgi:phosphatidylinositol alpha-1,6-mannosyltransferase
MLTGLPEIVETCCPLGGLADRVIFTGTVPAADLPHYYQSCELFVLPSVKKGFGIVFLEGMYYAKACVGTNAVRIPEVIVDSETGLIRDMVTPPDIARCVIPLLRNRRTGRAGPQGRERLERKFSFSAFRSRLEAIVRAHGCARTQSSLMPVEHAVGASD